MPPDALITTLLEEGGSKKKEIIRHAAEEASRIIEEARLRVEEADRRALSLYRKQMEDRAAVRINNAKREARRLVEEAEAETIRLTFNAVLRHLDEIRSHMEYPSILESLLDEVLGEFDEEVVVKGDSREMELVKEMAVSGQYGAIRCEEVPGLGGGLEASSMDGRIIVRNTFESRVARARELLIEEIGRRVRQCTTSTT